MYKGGFLVTLAGEVEGQAYTYLNELHRGGYAVTPSFGVFLHIKTDGCPSSAWVACHPYEAATMHIRCTDPGGAAKAVTRLRPTGMNSIACIMVWKGVCEESKRTRRAAKVAAVRRR